MNHHTKILPSNALKQVELYFLHLQNSICASLEQLDGGKTFEEDCWEQPGKWGKTRILTQGKIFERAGVNFSFVSGQELPSSATIRRPELAGGRFTAMGVSLVIHPDNPYIPTAHANVRLFFSEQEGAAPVWWFGGGCDLTPYYGFVEDCHLWHQTAFDACYPFGPSLYAEFKQWCDHYFFLKHRNEARGIGGLFFDDYDKQSFEHSFGLTQSIGNHFIKAYEPIVLRRRGHPFGAREKLFQKYRRGRYVEFNLIYDRGTLFGLQSGGRTESILMSLPPEVSWTYHWHPEEGSPEAKLYTDFLPVRNWLGA